MVSYYPLECLLSIFLLTTNFATNYAQIENSTQPELTISQGTLRGTTLTTRKGRSISAFLDIPYAQPPVGNLRFADPVAAGGWNGTLDASSDSSMCPQLVSNGSQLGEEDCLYLNVYTPQVLQTVNLLPVMVYIHGGVYKRGSKSSDSFGPQYLLDEDVVYVAPNYRLGPLGFLSTGDEVAPGNWGLKDQVLALKWVQDNIHHFGGDPDQVTLFGQSSGSVSVHLLTLSNATNGDFMILQQQLRGYTRVGAEKLINNPNDSNGCLAMAFDICIQRSINRRDFKSYARYITQSGSALVSWGNLPRTAYSNLAFDLGTYVGCSNETSDALISCLRTVDSSDIIATDPQFKVWEHLPDLIWGPTDEPADMEGAIITDSPENLLAAGKFHDLPWISGICRDEGVLKTVGYLQNEELLEDLLNNFDSLLPYMLGWTYRKDSGAAWVNATKAFYFNNDLTTNRSLVLENLTMLAGDSYFYYPAHKALQQYHAQAKSPQYFYTFNYRGTFSSSYSWTGTMVDYGIVHGDDLIYLFPRTSFSSDPNATMSETDWEMVDSMVQIWTSFAINGTPTASVLNGTTSWEPYSAEDDYLRIGNDSDAGLELQYSFFKERMQFWASIDSSEEEEEITVDVSGAITHYPNLLLLLLAASASYFFLEIF